MSYFYPGFGSKKHSMQEGPRINQFWGTYVIVIKLAYGPVHHGYIKITSKGMDVEVLVEITERGF